jgi:hypothetical protein
MKPTERRIAGVLAAMTCVVVLVASCVSPEEFQRETEAMCTDLGFKAGTPEFANCLTTTHRHKACQNCLPGALPP